MPFLFPISFYFCIAWVIITAEMSQAEMLILEANSPAPCEESVYKMLGRVSLEACAFEELHRAIFVDDSIPRQGSSMARRTTHGRFVWGLVTKRKPSLPCEISHGVGTEGGREGGMKERR